MFLGSVAEGVRNNNRHVHTDSINEEHTSVVLFKDKFTCVALPGDISNDAYGHMYISSIARVGVGRHSYIRNVHKDHMYNCGFD